MGRNFFLAGVMGILLSACHHPKRVIETSFYYWRQEFRISDVQRQLLDSLFIKKLYIKYFDVDWDKVVKVPEPMATISFPDSSYRAFAIVPVVFITNNTLEHCPADKVMALADIISQKISGINSFHQIKINEVQIDCDWTTATRDKYFRLLKEIKKRMPGHIFSCTIRLHQVKYKEKTGIPSVDRGMLMFYNMGKVEDARESNSIYDPDNAAKYVAYVKDYPLPLDVALPVFSWGVRYTDGYPRDLLNGLSENDLKNDMRFHAEKENWYLVNSPGYLHGYYLREHDRIRIEEINLDLCKKAARQLSDQMRTTTFTLAFFDLQTKNTDRYDLRDFQAICDILR